MSLNLLDPHAAFGVVGCAPAMKLKLGNPPIVEAVLDFDCDLPPGQDLEALEARAIELLGDAYPKHSRQWLQEYVIAAKSDASETTYSNRHTLRALRFHQEGGKQLVQLRALGYSFNRLAPYVALDDYLREIERTWHIYVDLARPSQVRQIRLRYINRILLPRAPEPLDLADYLKLGPRLPEDNLALSGFFNQYTAVEQATGLQVSVTLTSQPAEPGKLPIIFDNSALSVDPAGPEDWAVILDRIKALRGLKNRVFRNTLTEKCLELFQKP